MGTPSRKGMFSLKTHIERKEKILVHEPVQVLCIFIFIFAFHFVAKRGRESLKEIRALVSTDGREIFYFIGRWKHEMEMGRKDETSLYQASFLWVEKDRREAPFYYFVSWVVLLYHMGCLVKILSSLDVMGVNY